ncbi:hypothetical protein TOPH_09021 [Tolypocladium ophioglossoides CBS 100239]|uniref:Uncharacterized protein n=1 Tax=Tolypocladium ophioglossoides (strain CBS 100239) TaxID=1163406 RepID=A0A0L0MY10_TOLOC|nr:hypothetical protein TOPH_09021 [Tolypocladium ophioglossoides CBS 100239]
MTEIALRRIGNRIINAFFRQDCSSWLNIKPLLRMAQEDTDVVLRIGSLLNPFSPSKTDSPLLTDSFAAHAAAAGSSLDGQDLAVLHSLIASGVECALKTIDVRSRGHRQHGLWYDLRSIMGAAHVLLAAVKSGSGAWIPGGTDTLWRSAPSFDYWTGTPTPTGGKIAKVLGQFDFWAGESPDLMRYKEVRETAVRDVRGS